MTSYADLPSLQAWMSAGDDSAVTWTGDEQATAQLLLDAATRAIEQHTGRLFRAEAATTKDFWATSPYVLHLPDIRTITSLTYDSTGAGTAVGPFALALTEGTDFFKIPLVPFPDAGIWTGVQIAPYSSRGFWGGFRVRVTGDWGYVIDGAAPEPVQLACMMLASRWWTRKGAPLGIIMNGNIGTFMRISKSDQDVAGLLDPYKAASKNFSLV